MAENVLFCIVGSTPEVVTETLFGLLNPTREERQEPVTGGRIHVLTTGLMYEYLEVLPGQIQDFNAAYGTAWEFDETWDPDRGYGIEILRDEDGEDVPDVFNLEHNRLSANRILDVVRTWTGDDNVVLHASLAGGRKTMGTHLQQAMTWYGRPQDRLYHVIPSPDLEREIEENQDKLNPEWFYPQPGTGDSPQDRAANARQANWVHFCEQPFVRMRGLVPRTIIPDLDNAKARPLAFEEMVDISQILISDVGNEDINVVLTYGEIAQQFLLKISTIGVINPLKITLIPLHAAIYNFLIEHGNLAKEDGKVFNPSYVFDFRDELHEQFERFDVAVRKPGEKYHRLSSLALPRHKWGSPWRDEDEQNEDAHEERKRQITNVFSKLSNRFNQVLDGIEPGFSLKNSTNEKWVTVNLDKYHLDL